MKEIKQDETESREKEREMETTEKREEKQQWIKKRGNGRNTKK